VSLAGIHSLLIFTGNSGFPLKSVAGMTIKRGHYNMERIKVRGIGLL